MLIKELLQLNENADGPTAKRSIAGGAVKTQTGKFVKQVGSMAVYRREKSGKEFFDFVENPENGEFKFDKSTPIIYTYSPLTGNLTLGSGARWARREILTASPAGQRAGRRKEMKNDVDGALKVAIDHLKKYKPESSRHDKN